MLHCSSLVELDYSFIELRNVLDIDIGWGPHLPSLDAQPNFGFGEVIQGPKPKRQKRVVIEAKEYEALLKVSERMSYLENLVERQMAMMGSMEEAYTYKADPIFAVKASQAENCFLIKDNGPLVHASGSGFGFAGASA